jgi:Ca2+-binding RTX toxin-like protein
VTGTAWADRIDGQAGNDRLLGAGGNDRLSFGDDFRSNDLDQLITGTSGAPTANTAKLGA